MFKKESANNSFLLFFLRSISPEIASKKFSYIRFVIDIHVLSFRQKQKTNGK